MTHQFILRRAAGVVGLLVLAAACRGHDRADREGMLERADAKRLVGAWDVTVILQRPLTQLYDSVATARPVTGTMAFTENRSSDATVADFGTVTHKGVFDLDLRSFNLPVGGDGRIQSAVARTVPIRTEKEDPPQPATRDSVIIALDPDDSRLVVRMTGILAGDTITGSWTAEFLRTEATGRFSMRRRQLTP